MSQWILEEALQCYYCDGTLGIGCNDKEKGNVVTCQMKSSKELYYGDVCAIGHTGIKLGLVFTHPPYIYFSQYLESGLTFYLFIDNS